MNIGADVELERGGNGDISDELVGLIDCERKGRVCQMILVT